jgi:hypothetical protein
MYLFCGSRDSHRFAVLDFCRRKEVGFSELVANTENSSLKGVFESPLCSVISVPVLLVVLDTKTPDLRWDMYLYSPRQRRQPHEYRIRKENWEDVALNRVMV